MNPSAVLLATILAIIVIIVYLNKNAKSKMTGVIETVENQPPTGSQDETQDLIHSKYYTEGIYHHGWRPVPGGVYKRAGWNRYPYLRPDYWGQASKRCFNNDKLIDGICYRSDVVPFGFSRVDECTIANNTTGKLKTDCVRYAYGSYVPNLPEMNTDIIF